MSGPKPNPWIETLAPYVAGRARAEGVARTVKLSANESPLGASPQAIAAFRDGSETLHLYPDPDAKELRAAIAEVHGLEAERIICGAGSDEILHLVAQAFVAPGDAIIHSRYGFMMYPIVANSLGATPIAVPNRNWAADVDGILAAVTPRTKVVYLDNPNNPTGACLPRSEVVRLIEGLPDHVVLVYDAAYAECVDMADYSDGADLARRYPNVLMSRTFSKLYGLAALRIGWGYGAPSLIDAMNRIRMPFNANMPAQRAAMAAVRDREFLAHARAYTIAARRDLAAGIRALGLEVVESETNFLLIRFSDIVGKRASDANDYLTAKGYLLRWLPGQGLADCLRMTIGTREQNGEVVRLLGAFLAGY